VSVIKVLRRLNMPRTVARQAVRIVMMFMNFAVHTVTVTMTRDQEISTASVMVDTVLITVTNFPAPASDE
jgi:hypothetical protein